MGILPACVFVYHLHIMLMEVRRGHPLKLELQMVISHSVDAGNWVRSFGEAASALYLMRHLPSSTLENSWSSFACDFSQPLISAHGSSFQCMGHNPLGKCVSPKICTLWFIAVVKLQLWSSTKNDFQSGAHHSMRNCIQRVVALGRLKTTVLKSAEK